MKTVLLILPALALTTVSFAQPTEGQFMLNLAGNGRWGSRDSQYSITKHQRFTTQLSGAYFLTNRLAVGVQTEVKGSLVNNAYSSPNSVSSQVSSYNLRVGPYARYYFPMGRKTAFFLQAAAGLEERTFNIEQTNTSTSETEKGHYRFPSGAFAHITPGFAWYPNKRIAVEVTALEFGYEYRPYLTRSVHNIGLNALNAKLGATFFLGKGKEKQLPATP